MIDRRRSLVFVSAAVFSLPLLSACGAGSPPVGPLFEEVADSPHAYVYMIDGTEMEFTDGFETFAAPDDADVVIESIRSVGDSDEVTVIGTLVSGPLGENGTWQSFDAYPPVEGIEADTFEAEGARIPAGSGHYQILIGYRGVITEMSVRRGVEVTYRIEDKTYRDTLPASIIMCPPDEEQACLDEMDRPVEQFVDEQ
ncbi:MULTISPECIES: hypothetical protein [unclassified Microbacterium]|uniref:hypothetical protein n=1 Tax=unclassified Microbacterium TaxID=2609290 RepID=UPI00386362C2